MKKCLIDGLEVDAELVRTNSTAFGKTISGELAIPFRLELDANDVIADFNPYYQDFIDRESEAFHYTHLRSARERR